MRWWQIALSAAILVGTFSVAIPATAGPVGSYTRANTSQCYFQRPPSPGVGQSKDGQLCRTVCSKQLKCSGQAARGPAMTGCVNACTQALRVGNPVASKPWRAAAACDRKSCGSRYDRCVDRKMKESSPSERKCKAVCEHRKRCAPGGINQQACESRCVRALTNPGSVDYYFESATYQCRKKSCGLDTEVCVARKLGGPNAKCASICEKRLKCAGTLTRDQFVSCMPSCFQQVMSASTNPRMEAEADCSGCGVRLDRCIARRLGGYHPYCHKNCAKRQDCGRPDAPGTSQIGLARCRDACVSAVKAESGDVFKTVQAVETCRRQRCGSSFDRCLAKRLQPKRSPVATVAAPTKPAASPEQNRCKRLCKKEKECAPNGGGPSCLRRCVSDVGTEAEFKAIEGCTRVQCGRAWDKCVARKLGVKKPPLQCIDSCRKQATCDGGRTGGFVSTMVSCLRGCRSETKYLARIKKCQSVRCGQKYTACMAAAIVEPPPPPIKPPPVRVDPRIELCRQLCTKASMCGKGRADELCQSRCVSDGSARKEFKARARCARKTCRQYESCVYTELGVRSGRLKCLFACQKKAECKQVRGEKTSIKSIVRCANRCKYSKKELAAIQDCGKAGCGIAYDLCMKHKLEPPVVEKPVAVVPTMSKQEKRCRDTCAKSETCVLASGGEDCVKRCLSNRAIREFRARHSCRNQRCERYEACILRTMDVPSVSTACTQACRHDLNCRPPGESRNLAALSQCVRKCPFKRKEMNAIIDCAPIGCGPQFQQCFLKKSGQLALLKQVKTDCEKLCQKADQCESGTGGNPCIRACVDAKARSKEFSSRQYCAGKSCAEYGQCVLNRMGVIAGMNHRCYAVCRFDTQCDRSKRRGDLGVLTSCLKQCTWSDDALAAREDCQVEGCGSMYRSCVDRAPKSK